MAAAPPVIDRPFYFIVVLWGERFRNYFLDLCLPSLLSPGNLPALRTPQRTKFLIWTRPDDWTAIREAEVFRLLETHAEPVFFEISDCPSDVQPCVHMGVGHRSGLQMAYEAKAYPFVLQPDSMFSDGTIRRLQELAADGVQAVLVPALRFAAEPLFENLKKFGLPLDGRNGTATPITLTGRQLAQAALPSMHRETLTYEWDASYFHSSPSAAWWRVPGEDGIVLHCYSWAALLLDFTAVSSHDLSTFDERSTIDDNYLYKNFGQLRRVYLVRDSDEMFLVSWTPEADKSEYYALTPQPNLQRRITGNLYRKQRFRRWFYSDSIDPLRRCIFFATVRWHAAPMTAAWHPVERRALEALLSCVAPPAEAQRLIEFEEGASTSASVCRLLLKQYQPVARLFLQIFGWFIRTRRIVWILWGHRMTILRRLLQILEGDRTARDRAARRVHEVVNQIIGKC